MTVPPQGGWQPGPIPPNQGQPFGQPFDPTAYNQQQPPPPGWQQGSWAQHPPPPPAKGGGLKWLLIAVAVLLVVAVSIGATLLFTRGGGNSGDPTPTSGAPSDIASANDTGPVSIITSDPTCQAFNGIINRLSEVEKRGWGDQRNSLPAATDWTSEQRSQVQSVATAMKNAVQQVLPLTKLTPHRVVRSIYEQFIAYGRAYADAASDYTPAANFLADANVNFGNALTGICTAIDNDSAAGSLGVAPASPPTQVATPADPNDSQRFVQSQDASCTSWIANYADFNSSTDAWQKLDSNVAGAQWTPEERSIQLDSLPFLKAFGEKMEAAAAQSDSPAMKDFAALASLYFRAYAAKGESYVASDSWLSYTGLRLNNAVYGACQAAGG